MFFACFSLPTLGSSRIHYLGATTYRLSVYSIALLHLHIVLLSLFLTLPLNGQYLTFATHERKPGIISLKTVRESKNLSHPSLGIAALLGLPHLPTSYIHVSNNVPFIPYIQQQRTRFLARFFKPQPKHSGTERLDSV